MTLTEQQREARKDFRKYLRENGLAKGSYLSSMIKAAEDYLPAFINIHFDSKFPCLYDNVYTIGELLGYSAVIKDNEDWLAEPYGYISSKCLEYYIQYLAKKSGVEIKKIRPKKPKLKDKEDQTWIEGKEISYEATRYERDRSARAACIAKYGCKCYVCGMDFKSTYGEIGDGFIEIHHRIPVSERGGEYKLKDGDLVPLCSNCHSMVHRHKKAMDVDELKKIYDEIHHKE
jgi:5-methylcytosine-specific restriction endonuclease McrA